MIYDFRAVYKWFKDSMIFQFCLQVWFPRDALAVFDPLDLFAKPETKRGYGLAQEKNLGTRR